MFLLLKMPDRQFPTFIVFFLHKNFIQSFVFHWKFHWRNSLYLKVFFCQMSIFHCVFSDNCFFLIISDSQLFCSENFSFFFLRRFFRVISFTESFLVSLKVSPCIARVFFCQMPIFNCFFFFFLFLEILSFLANKSDLEFTNSATIIERYSKRYKLLTFRNPHFNANSSNIMVKYCWV